MKDIDRPDDVQGLTEPARCRRPRVQLEPERLMSCPEKLHGISAHFCRRRDIGQQPTVGVPETKIAIGQSIDLLSLLMDGSVVTATKHGEIRERRGPAVRPVADVMALTEARPTAREATAVVAMEQRPP